MEKDAEKQIQSKYMHLKLLEQQIKEAQKQVQALDAQLVELYGVKQGLEDFGSVKTGSEIMVSLSPGIYANATLKDNKDLLVNVGAGTIVKKSVNDTASLVQSQSDEIEKFRQQLVEQLEKFVAKAQEIEQELQKLVE